MLTIKQRLSALSLTFVAGLVITSLDTVCTKLGTSWFLPPDPSDCAEFMASSSYRKSMDDTQDGIRHKSIGHAVTPQKEIWDVCENEKE